jgi:hypothetical protein
MSRKNSKPTVIGIDIGKNMFHLIGLDGAGEIVMRARWQGAPLIVDVKACTAMSWRWHWPINWPASLGGCLPVNRITKLKPERSLLLLGFL